MNVIVYKIAGTIYICNEPKFKLKKYIFQYYYEQNELIISTDTENSLFKFKAFCMYFFFKKTGIKATRSKYTIVIKMNRNDFADALQRVKNKLAVHTKEFTKQVDDNYFQLFNLQIEKDKTEKNKKYSERDTKFISFLITLHRQKFGFIYNTKNDVITFKMENRKAERIFFKIIMDIFPDYTMPEFIDNKTSVQNKYWKIKRNSINRRVKITGKISQTELEVLITKIENIIFNCRNSLKPDGKFTDFSLLPVERLSEYFDF